MSHSLHAKLPRLKTVGWVLQVIWSSVIIEYEGREPLSRKVIKLGKSRIINTYFER